jgi:hypothetical protein
MEHAIVIIVMINLKNVRIFLMYLKTLKTTVEEKDIIKEIEFI